MEGSTLCKKITASLRLGTTLCTAEFPIPTLPRRVQEGWGIREFSNSREAETEVVHPTLPRKTFLRLAFPTLWVSAVGFGFQCFENGKVGAINIAYEVARNGAFLKINFGQRFS